MRNLIFLMILVIFVSLCSSEIQNSTENSNSTDKIPDNFDNSTTANMENKDTLGLTSDAHNFSGKLNFSTILIFVSLLLIGNN
ncbi:hypothetical protein BpHYR1_041354 [Brachionus plicatilis]|uniref:Uncharacterized protein n=1 Tax=Brachionus plicatilis TaxID=10195 RepID=A0A3M7SLL1_BRAPC|nr:hypothetical protein BpHYR1_041354 [Brachionus plicatilis]